MSDFDKGACRAQGAFDEMLYQMKAKMEREGRSEEYISAFWYRLGLVAEDYAETQNALFEGND